MLNVTPVVTASNDATMEEGLDCYDPERRVFPRIEKKIGSGQELNKRDVLQILRWKLGRIRGDYSKTVADDRLVEINKAVVKAAKPGCGIEALQGLDNIPGIGLAVATAILTVCYPKEFTIIDVRVLEILDLFPTILAEDKRKEHNAGDWTAKGYIDEYLPKVKERAEVWGCSLRDADRALWGQSVSRNIDAVIASSREE